MQNGQGLKKGLVAQWSATRDSGEKFQFLKAFLLDRDMTSIKVLSEDKSKEKFTEMPLCLIRQKYEPLPGGKQFVKDIIQSQKGRKHPQSSDDEMKIYKVYVGVDITSGLVANTC
ncbi:unnamed protein product [Symbiodinium pilosum]|uniref:Uncharacterized protein n=1 Tax=Symbiodinium pilosum TaxID=2952 RepID=A0A812LR28_SYMPI|nr:unnamed protein product [Symbiodinium pilosum]